MTTILAWFTGSAFPWILGIGAAVIAAIGLRQSGKDAAYNEVSLQELKQASAALRVTQNINSLSDTDVDTVLRKQFSAS